jgi:hypothetical protein
MKRAALPLILGVSGRVRLCSIFNRCRNGFEKRLSFREVSRW